MPLQELSASFCDVLNELKLTNMMLKQVLFFPASAALHLFLTSRFLFLMTHDPGLSSATHI